MSDSDGDGIEPPRWLLVSAFVASAGVLSFGAVGLLLAVNNAYSTALALPLGTLGLIALVALVWPVLPDAPVGTRNAGAIALGGFGAILLITVWNCANASQHVLINRDGGVYAETGRWIARSGGIGFPTGIGPFRNAATPVFGFAHLLPALLAEAYSVGGSDGLYHLPPLLGGIALLEFFVLAWRVLRRPGFALAATLTLALILPQVAFTRDTYSEIPSQILLFAALALLVDRRGMPHWRIALFAGLLLGATQATRIDATVFFISVPVFLAFTWLRTDPDAPRRALVAPIAALVLGMLPVGVLGLVDLMHHTGSYWSGLWRNERSLVYLALASAVGCVLLVSLWRYVFRVVRVMPWRTLSWVAGGLVLAAALGAVFLRPHLMINHAGTLTALQEHGRLVVTGTRLDYERSMIWMSWYLGPVTLGAAIVGASLLPVALVRGRWLHVAAPLVVLLPGSVLYLWSASAHPDHIWVTRRYLVGAFPLLILLAFGLATFLWTAGRSVRWTRAARGAAIVIAVVAVAFPVYILIPVGSMREEVGYLSVIQDACDTMGKDSAVLVMQELQFIPNDVHEEWTVPALRVWCGIQTDFRPYGTVTGAELRQLSREWNALGKRFFVAGLTAAPILALVPDARVTPTRRVVDPDWLEQTMTRTPSGYAPESFAMVVAEIPPQ